MFYESYTTLSIITLALRIKSKCYIDLQYVRIMQQLFFVQDHIMQLQICKNSHFVFNMSFVTLFIKFLTIFVAPLLKFTVQFWRRRSAVIKIKTLVYLGDLNEVVIEDRFR